MVLQLEQEQPESAFKRLLNGLLTDHVGSGKILSSSGKEVLEVTWCAREWLLPANCTMLVSNTSEWVKWFEVGKNYLQESEKLYKL